MRADDTGSELAELEAIEGGPEDMSTVLRGYIELLPARSQRVVFLFYNEDRSVNEVADMLKMPVGTERTVLHRARAELGEQLKLRGLDDPTAW